MDRDLVFFEAMMGAEAVKKLLEKLDLDKEIKKLKKLLSSLLLQRLSL